MVNIPDQIQKRFTEALAKRVADAPEGADPCGGLAGSMINIAGIKMRIVSVSHQEDDKVSFVLDFVEELEITVSPDPSPDSVKNRRVFSGVIR